MGAIDRMMEVFNNPRQRVENWKEKGNIWVAPLEATYFTKPLVDKETEILDSRRRRPVGNFILNLGLLEVTETIRASRSGTPTPRRP